MADLAQNRKALHDFEILQKFEGGLVLTGPEVKSIRNGSVNLKGAFLTFQHGELYLKNAHVSAYAPAGKDDAYNPTQDRKVLVHKKELNLLRGKNEAERLTLVPLSVYLSRSRIKLSFALARGKKKFEKREAIKARDVSRDIRSYDEYDV